MHIMIIDRYACDAESSSCFFGEEHSLLLFPGETVSFRHFLLPLVEVVQEVKFKPLQMGYYDMVKRQMCITVSRVSPGDL